MTSQVHRDTPLKGAHHGYTNKTDHPALGEVPQGHSHSLRGCGLLWPGTVECGCRIYRAALEWAPQKWTALEWPPPERDASQWVSHQWDPHPGAAHERAP